MRSVRDQFDTQGFLRLEEAIPCHLLASLRQGLEPLRVARDEWGERPTRYQTILEPKYFHRSFVDFLNLEVTHRAAVSIIGTEELMVAGLACLLGCAEHVVCKWHRDTASMDPAELDLLLNQYPNALVQTNCAVYDDVSLWVVPGSHRRGDTPEETAWSGRFDELPFVGPIEAARAVEPEVFAGMPGAIHVRLKAGDCLLYNPLLWHAAEYRPEWKRCTLHGGWKDVRLLEEFSLLRWGLNHNPWLLEPGYMGDLGPHLGPQLARYQQAVRTYAS